MGEAKLMQNRGDQMMETTVATIRKNASQEIRISLSEYKGHNLINIRTWVHCDGELRPTQKGIALCRDRLPQLIDALLVAEQAARQAGESESRNPPHLSGTPALRYPTRFCAIKNPA